MSSTAAQSSKHRPSFLISVANMLSDSFSYSRTGDSHLNAYPSSLWSNIDFDTEASTVSREPSPARKHKKAEQTRQKYSSFVVVEHEAYKVPYTSTTQSLCQGS